MFTLKDFIAPVDTKDIDRSEVHYLGSYASEVRYFIQKLGIPFETLFALDKQILAGYCGLFRSLCNAAYRAK